MKYLTYVFLFVVALQQVEAQVTYKKIDSDKLGQKRELKIQLPRGYDTNQDKKYPVIVVFDGDYLFEAVAGNVDYLSYWEDMPEAIVVGVNQVETRNLDSFYSPSTMFPADEGAEFFEFVTMELLPYIDTAYRTENFRMAVGHGKMANFINYYLLKPKPFFQSYLTLSPDLAPEMGAFLEQRIPTLERKVFYYLASATKDVKHIKEGTNALNKALERTESPNFIKFFDTFEGASHYSLPAYAVPKALEKIFFIYQPISKEEYKERILTSTESPVEYLKGKYSTIKKLFGIKKKIVVNDFKAIEAAINKNGTFEDLEELGKIARDEYPDTLLGHYYLARFHEEMGKPKKAMKMYQSSYVLEEIAGITKDEMLQKAEAIKADFGF